jgi:uncharacterized protein
MNNPDVIKAVEEFAKTSIKEFDSGHDWWHLSRVRNLALFIQQSEDKGDRYIIELAALLHDIDDKKFRKAGGVGAEQSIKDLLNKFSVKEEIINEVVSINKYISFSSGQIIETKSDEFKIVQDADRLDAIGAIGIARAFNYGGFKNNPIYIPGKEKEKEKGKMEPSTIGHFYDKLLKLKELMNTSTGKDLAEKRHYFLEIFLTEFYSEWTINDKRSF